MAHMIKLSGPGATHILGHCQREHTDDHLKYHTKSDIDPSQTHLNVSFCPHGQPTPYFQERRESVGVKRKDQVTLVSWVVTLPRELLKLPREKQVAFFRSCSDFVANRYGQDNFVGGFVHFDETTPHIHMLFMPVLNGRFCAKKMLNKRDLSAFHKDLAAHLAADKSLKFKVTEKMIVPGKTKENKTIEELKKGVRQNETLKKENEQLTGEIVQKKKQKKELLDRNEELSYKIANKEYVESWENYAHDLEDTLTEVLGHDRNYALQYHEYATEDRWRARSRQRDDGREM